MQEGVRNPGAFSFVPARPQGLAGTLLKLVETHDLYAFGLRLREVDGEPVGGSELQRLGLDVDEFDVIGV